MECSSRFAIGGDDSTSGLCLGVPIECTVTLDPALCVPGTDNFTTDTLDVSLFDSGAATASEPPYSFTQTDSLLSVVLDYIPEVVLSIITVELGAIAGVDSNCSFFATDSSTVLSSTGRCLYPVTFELIHSSPAHPAVVKGGEMVEVGLSMANTGDLLVEQLYFCLESVHPALTLVRYTHSSEMIMNRALPDSCILEGEVIRLRETLFANLTFRVEPFVLPRAKLYCSFGLTHHLEGYGEVAFEQVLNLFDEFTADEVTQGNWTFSVPFYAERDHVDFTFPPHVDDIFSIDIPITVPCVSTDVNVSVVLPEFLSDTYTMFFVDVTEVSYELPPNMERVTTLCRYGDARFDRATTSQCHSSSMIVTRNPVTITKSEMKGPGVDQLLISLGPVFYFLNDTSECMLESSTTADCACFEEDIVITLTGRVADDSTVCDDRLAHPFFVNSSCGIFCENQTLADNMTSLYSYTVEVTTDLAPLQLRFEAAVTLDIGEGEGIFPVNASMPAIAVPINSFSGDAGDSYNLTFGVLHDSEYSSFTGYELNYTFSVEPHLRPEENITICFFNGSSKPAHCEEALLINLTISRCGDHPV